MIKNDTKWQILSEIEAVTNYNVYIKRYDNIVKNVTI